MAAPGVCRVLLALFLAVHSAHVDALFWELPWASGKSTLVEDGTTPPPAHHLQDVDVKLKRTGTLPDRMLTNQDNIARLVSEAERLASEGSAAGHAVTRARLLSALAQCDPQWTLSSSGRLYIAHVESHILSHLYRNAINEAPLSLGELATYTEAEMDTCSHNETDFYGVNLRSLLIRRLESSVGSESGAVDVASHQELAMALHVLLQRGPKHDVSLNILNKAFTHLLTGVDDTGSYPFGIGIKGRGNETSWVLRALSSLPTPRRDTERAKLDRLKLRLVERITKALHRSTDGSVDGDPVSTALALQALRESGAKRRVTGVKSHRSLHFLRSSLSHSPRPSLPVLITVTPVIKWLETGTEWYRKEDADTRCPRRTDTALSTGDEMHGGGDGGLGLVEVDHVPPHTSPRPLRVNIRVVDEVTLRPDHSLTVNLDHPRQTILDALRQAAAADTGHFSFTTIDTQWGSMLVAVNEVQQALPYYWTVHYAQRGYNGTPIETAVDKFLVNDGGTIILRYKDFTAKHL